LIASLPFNKKKLIVTSQSDLLRNNSSCNSLLSRSEAGSTPGQRYNIRTARLQPSTSVYNYDDITVCSDNTGLLTNHQAKKSSSKNHNHNNNNNGLTNDRRDLVQSAGTMKSHPGKKPVRVHLLSGDSILLVFQVKACVKDVFDQICNMYNIKDNQFFGLSAVVDNEHRFMELNQKLTKYAPKDWGKELKRRESDLSMQPTSIFTIQFQVEYFVEHPKLIRDAASRHYYYLQMKRNVIQSKVPVQDTVILSLAATSLRLDHGCYDSQIHIGEYFDPCDHVPVWFVEKWSRDYLISNLPTMHMSISESSSFNLEAEYIRKASTIDDVPVHYYKLYKTKKEERPTIVLGVYHKGIRIHQIQTNSAVSPPGSPISNNSSIGSIMRNKDVKYILDLEFP